MTFISYPSLYLVVNPLLLTPELEEGGNADNQHSPYRNGGTGAPAAGHKGLPIEQVDQTLHLGQRRVGILHHHVNQIIDLDGCHQTHDHGDKQSGRNHRQGDLEKLRHFAGAVDGGGLIITFGDILKAGEQQHRIIADGAPDRHNGAGNQSYVGVGDPRYMGAENLVENAVLSVEDPPPYLR